MNIFDYLVQEKNEFVAWCLGKEPEFITAIQSGSKMVSKLQAFIQSPDGKTIEQFVDENVPDGQKWSLDVKTVISQMGSDLSAVKSPSSVQAITESLIGEITSILHGGKHPDGIGGYIAEARTILTGQ